MKLLKPLLLAAVALAATQAHAGYTFTSTTVPVGTYTAPSFTDGVNATVETSSVELSYLQPKGTTGSFLVVSVANGTSGSATIDTLGASSYSFVWGSPDTFNIVDIYSGSNTYAMTFNGSALMAPMASDGNNDNTRLFTITGTDGATIDHIVLKSNGVAFETAVAAVPEPETYALMLAGLGAVGFIARRRGRN